MMDVTGVEISWACLSARKETLETFKLRDYQRDQPQGQNPDGAIRSSDGLQQMIVIQCTTANFTQIMTWKFTGEDLAEECFPSGCCLQDYADTGTSKMQVTSEEAKFSQSWKQNLLLREILSDGTKDLIELHDCYRQTWVHQLHFEDLLYSLVSWWLKLICFTVYSTHWFCEGSSNTLSLRAVEILTEVQDLQVYRLIVLSCWVLFIQDHKISH